MMINSTKTKNCILLLTLFALTSCQDVVVPEKHTGVHFKRFGGGPDTTNFYSAGNYTIPSWDYVINYQTGVRVGESIGLGRFQVQPQFILPAKNAGKFHKYIGGDPADRVLKVVKAEHSKLDSLSRDLNNPEFQKLLMERSRAELSKVFIELNRLIVEEDK